MAKGGAETPPGAYGRKTAGLLAEEEAVDERGGKKRRVDGP
jgi:hypothetical protein